jgi:small conductance mechanosensitive channel
VVIASVVVYFIVKQVGERFVSRVSAKGPDSAARAATLWLMMRRVVQALLIVFVVLTIFTIWGWSVAPFIAIATVIGAAVGFGAQHIVRDVLSGFFILAEDQYQIGDTVSLAGASGIVEDIQFRVTVLRDDEGNVHYVPNGQIGVASNYTRVYARPVIDVRIPYGQDIDRAIEVMTDELGRLETDPAMGSKVRGPAEILGVQELTDAAVVIRGRIMTDPDQRWAVKSEALRRLKNRFDVEGIPLSNP